MDRFIKLTTDEPLDKSIVRAWFNCIIAHAPSGIVHAVSVEDDDGERHVVKLIHRTSAGNHSYVVPLTRNLHRDEVDHLVDQFAELYPKLDFDIETSETRLKASDETSIPLDADKHLRLCTAFAKQRHEEWVRDYNNAGWRFGTAFDADEKTHPLLRPWDQLPDRFRVPDLTWPQRLVSMLNDNGYVVMPRASLERLTKSLI
jgi:hypothetical protein